MILIGMVFVCWWSESIVLNSSHLVFVEYFNALFCTLWSFNIGGFAIVFSMTGGYINADLINAFYNFNLFLIFSAVNL